MGFSGNLGAFRHGGMCCGVTHLYGFNCLPAAKLPAQPPMPLADRTNYTKETPQYWGFFHTHYPDQTALERFHATIQHVIGGQPATATKPIGCGGRSWGCIEIVLTPIQQDQWNVFVLAAGFVEVMEFRNSNTMKMLKMYLLDTSKYIKPPAPKPVEVKAKVKTIKKVVKKPEADPFSRQTTSPINRWRREHGLPELP